MLARSSKKAKNRRVGRVGRDGRTEGRSQESIFLRNVLSRAFLTTGSPKIILAYSTLVSVTAIRIPVPVYSCHLDHTSNSSPSRAVGRALYGSQKDSRYPSLRLPASPSLGTTPYSSAFPTNLCQPSPTVSGFNHIG